MHVAQAKAPKLLRHECRCKPRAFHVCIVCCANLIRPVCRIGTGLKCFYQIVGNGDDALASRGRSDNTIAHGWVVLLRISSAAGAAWLKPTQRIFILKFTSLCK